MKDPFNHARIKAELQAMANRRLREIHCARSTSFPVAISATCTFKWENYSKRVRNAAKSSLKRGYCDKRTGGEDYLFGLLGKDLPQLVVQTWYNKSSVLWLDIPATWPIDGTAACIAATHFATKLRLAYDKFAATGTGTITGDAKVGYRIKLVEMQDRDGDRWIWYPYRVLHKNDTSVFKLAKERLFTDIGFAYKELTMPWEPLPGEKDDGHDGRSYTLTARI